MTIFKQMSFIISIHTELADLGTKILPFKQLPELTFAKSYIILLCKNHIA